ncbi:hypothetical protein [uncultured Chryseobacterium sp.]|uniref:hypothetical protein n=1 Tax=uncultured Chryseobacterium sp. TaxID=259322 RepID=UPI0026001394|nr:hypothetical protein [uncultured Chryseobacterium sp.]
MKKNHVALFFFVIVTFGCNRKNDIPQGFNKQTIHDAIRKNREIRKRDAPVNTGFVVLKKENSGIIILYNEDLSVWKTFLLDDYPGLAALDPFILKPEDALIAFELTGKKGDFYKVSCR